jgi:hypothetical protein
MLNKKEYIKFLLKARTKTYAGESGGVEPLLPGSKQFEYSEKKYTYRDVFNIGNGKFAGLETVYQKNKPVWSMSYYGNFEKMTEEETDKILRKALIDKWDKVRLWNKVIYKIGKYVYINEGSGNINEFDGGERIEKNGEILYFFYYASGIIG